MTEVGAPATPHAKRRKGNQMSDVIAVQLREICGVRSGDKGKSSDLTVFADDRQTYDALVEQLTTDRVHDHFGNVNDGEVVRYLAPNVLAIKFVLPAALGGGGALSL